MSEVGEAAGGQVTAGALLREAREAQGLHIATLAANLKVPVRKLEALEEGRHDQLGDAVFIRALASSVARTLKIDPQPVLERLPHTAQPRLVQDKDGINAPFRSPRDGPRPGVLHQVSRPVVLIVAALLVAALAVLLLPVAYFGGDQPAPVANASSDPALPLGTPPAPNRPAGPSAGDPTIGASPPLMASTTLSQPARIFAPAPAAATAAATRSPAVAVPSAVAASAPASFASGQIRSSGVVTFRTRGNSWIQVTDAKGTPVFRRVMEAGETAGASGVLPLSVTIGSVEQTEVLVRGKPYNLAPVSRDNVARFEVK